MHDPNMYEAKAQSGSKRRAAEPCQKYEGGPGYGEFLDGNPCRHCRWPQTKHSAEARREWETPKTF